MFVLIPPYFEHDAFTHHALNALDASGSGELAKKCLKSGGKLAVGRKWLVILVMMGTRRDSQSFSR